MTLLIRGCIDKKIVISFFYQMLYGTSLYGTSLYGTSLYGTSLYFITYLAKVNFPV